MILEGANFKIVNISGSPHGVIGNTQFLVKTFAQRLEEKGANVELVNHYVVKEHVEECRGCTKCMRKGECVMSEKDDVKVMVQDLLSADLVVFSSPIYVLNVTSLMKKFFDRTAYMTHRIVLENKLGFYVLSSQGLGIDTVSAYMQSVMEAMGVTVLGSIKGTAIFHNQFLNQEEIDQSIDEILTSLEQDFYKETQLYSESEKKRREKFSSLMDQEEISKKLFHEDYKYWANKKETSEIL